MKKVIVINGAATAGKDTFVEYFIKHAETSVFVWSTIRTVKELARHLGWNGEKDNDGRRFLSDIKDAWTRYNDGPFQEIVAKYKKYSRMYEDFVLFVHVREPAEIAKVKARFPDCTTILINRLGLPLPDNHADQKVYDYGYDFYIDNSHDLENLKFAARHMAWLFGAMLPGGTRAKRGGENYGVGES